MGQHMKVIGLKINNMGLVLKNGQIKVYMKVIIKMAKSMDMENFYGQMGVNTKVNLMKII